VLARDGHTREAYRELERAVELDASAAWPWFELGKLRFAAGDRTGAAEALAHAAEAEPEHEHAGFFAAWAARAAGDAESAEKFRQLAAALDPGLVGRQIAAAEAELAAGRRAEALEQVELGLAVSPRDMQALELRRRIKPVRAR